MARSVSRFEANLLTILYAIIRERPISHAMLKIVQSSPQPDCLSRNAVELVQQALAKSVSLWLARSDGWQIERFLRDGSPVAGQVWKRTSPSSLGLDFSAESLNFLVWLTTSEPLQPNEEWMPKKQALTLGDQVLLFRAIDVLRQTPLGSKWFQHVHFFQNPLVAIHFPDSLSNDVGLSQLRFTPWMHGPGSAVLECLQSSLAMRWVEIERSKTQVHAPQKMVQIGKSQQAVLDAFANAAEASNRLDLCRFLLSAISQLTSEEMDPRNWVRSLDVGGMRMADRTSTYSAASAFLSFAKRMRAWTQQCSSVGYFDEGYSAAQLWLADWERYDGDVATTRAQSIVQDLKF